MPVEIVVADRLEVRVFAEDGAGVAPDLALERGTLVVAEFGKRQHQVAVDMRALASCGPTIRRNRRPKADALPGSSAGADPPEQVQQASLGPPARSLQHRRAVDPFADRAAQEQRRHRLDSPLP